MGVDRLTGCLAIIGSELIVLLKSRLTPVARKAVEPRWRSKAIWLP